MWLNPLSTFSRPYHSYQKIAEHLVIVCFYHENLRDWNKEISPKLDLVENTLLKPWRDKNDLITTHQSFQRFDWSPNSTPFSLYPFSPEECADILCANLNIVIHMNLSDVFRQFETMGWKVSDSILNYAETDYTKLPDYFCLLHKGGHWMKIPPDLIARIAFETLKPSAIISMIEDTQLPETSQTHQEARLVRFKSESEIWL